MLRRLVLVLLVGVMTVAACAEAEESAPPAGEPPGEDASAVERRMERMVFDLVNLERRERGLPEVEWNDQLAELARAWSRHMAEQGRLRHQDPERMLERAEGFVAVGENIFWATGGAPASTIHVAWMRSDGHRANVLRDGFNRLGVGIVCTADGHVWATERFGATAAAGVIRGGGAVPPEQPIVAERSRGPSCPGSPATGEVRLDHGA